MDKQILKVEKRELLGRKVKQLRKKGILPGNVFGKDVESVSLQLPLSEFNKVYKETGETGLIELQVNGDKKPVLIHNLQKDPVSDMPIHVDFLQVNLKQKVTADVPVEAVGESPAEKQGLGTVVQYINEIEVEALPTDLLEKFVIDVSKLEEVDQAILVKDLKYDKAKIELKVDSEEIIAKVEAQKEEVIEEPVAPEVEEGAEGVSAEGEGEAPAEQGEQEEEAQPQKE